MSERYYVNLPLTLGPITLEGPEAHHLATVSRFRPGDEVCLFNGDGQEYSARIVHVKRREVALEVVTVGSPDRELAFALEVAAPMPKGDRGQFLIEKLTELGVTTFVPLICQRSNTHPRDHKREKLDRYVIEASKQCGRNVLMKIEEPIAWTSHCRNGSVDDFRVIAHPYDASPLSMHARSATTRIAVGPEGGFTDDEISLAIEHRWRPVNLGPRILRIETAAILLASILTGNL
jgi:16S rRNA (uracil1498-N3)-methyltransferase